MFSDKKTQTEKRYNRSINDVIWSRKFDDVGQRPIITQQKCAKEKHFQIILAHKNQTSNLKVICIFVDHS